MFSRLQKLSVIIALIVFTQFSFANEVELFAGGEMVPSAPKLNVKSYILIDANSGTVLAAKNPEEKIEPASMTKIMTMYVISHALKKNMISLTDKVRVSNNARMQEGSRMFLKQGEKVSVEELIKGIIVQSGNDASVAMAEYIATSEDAFTELMNKAANQIGLENTHFANSTGLPNSELYTNSQDLAKLTQALIRNFPDDYKAWYGIRKFTHNDIQQSNRNNLLWHSKAIAQDTTVDGVKTGHTDSSGYSVVASAEQSHFRLIAVVSGAKDAVSRTSAARELLAYGFRFFETHKLYEADQAIVSPRVWGSASKHIGVGLQNPLYITIPNSEYKNLKPEINVPAAVHGPVTKGQKLGSITLYLNDKQLGEQPLVALQDSKKAGLFSRAKDRIISKFSRLGSKKAN